MISRSRMRFHFSLISNHNIASISECVSVKGFFITLGTRAFVLNRIRSKDRIEIEQGDSLILVYQGEIHFQIQTTVTTTWYSKKLLLQVIPNFQIMVLQICWTYRGIESKNYMNHHHVEWHDEQELVLLLKFAITLSWNLSIFYSYKIISKKFVFQH